MSTSKKPMHQDFARWYETVSIGDNTVKRQLRWTGILNVVENAEWETVEALLRLAYGVRQPPSATIIQAIRQHFKAADEAFEMNGNDRELQVLAGACLVALMEDAQAQEAETAALAVTTTALVTGRSSNLPMDLASIGERAIVSLSEISRERPSLTAFREQMKFDFEKAKAKVSQQSDWQGVIDAFTMAADSTRELFNHFAIRLTKVESAAERYMQTQDEELQMLWWLTGQRSEDFDCSFEALSAQAQPFIFANELANLTESLPGPASVKAMLSRAGLKERKKLAVTAVVNAIDSVWLQSMVEDIEPSPVSTPMHFAIKRQLETGAGDAWVAGWAAATNINAGHALSPLTIGELFYRERLLVLFRFYR